MKAGDRIEAHFLEESCSLPQDERIANPVKPILPDLLLCHLWIERVGAGVRGYGSRMVRRIEVRDVDGIG